MNIGEVKDQRSAVSVHALWAGALSVMLGGCIVAAAETSPGWCGGGALILLGFKAFQSAIVLETRRQLRDR